MDKIKTGFGGKMWDFKFASVDELVLMGEANLSIFVLEIQDAIGNGNELHPDWMDALDDALDEMGIDPVVFWGELEINYAKCSYCGKYYDVNAVDHEEEDLCQSCFVELTR